MGPSTFLCMSTLHGLSAESTRRLRRLTVDRLVSVFGGPVVQRGISYHADKRVLVLRAVGGTRVHSLVAGTAARPYTTAIDLIADDDLVVGWCTCPLGADCKHLVATLLAARAALPDEEPVGLWERRLAPLAQQPADALRLGLEMQLVGSPANRGLGSPELLLRPLLPAKRGGWRKAGLTWDDLLRPDRLGLDPAHREALAAVVLAARAREGNRWGWYGSGPKHLELGNLGPVGFELLNRVVAEGVRVVPVEGLAEVVLESTPAVFQLSGAADGDGLRLTPELVVADLPDAVTTHPLGADAGVLLVLSHTEAGAVARLHPIDPPLSRDILQLLHDGPVHVPGSAGERFRRTTLAGLRRRFTVVGDAPMMREPEISGPTLAVHVTAQPEHELSIDCHWRYRVDEAVVDVEPGHPIGADVPGLPDRDLPGERRLARSLGWVVGYLAAKDQDGTPLLRPSSLTRGVTTARFVSEVLPRLQAHPQVELTVEGELAEYRQVLSAPEIEFSAVEDADPTRTDWFDLGVAVRMDGHLVPFRALFEALAARRKSLLLTSGLWFSLDRPEFDALRELIEEARGLQDRSRPPDQLQLNPLHAGLWEELVALGVVTEQSTRWASRVSALLAAENAEPPHPPAGLTATLRPYQRAGFGWLSSLWDAGLGGILADDMGLGKTVQVLAAVARAAEQGRLADRPVLVVCPTSVVGTWAEQAARFTPGLRVTTVTATLARRRTPVAELAAEADVLVTSYTLLRLEADAYTALPWSAMVLDEAQAVKNYRAKTYREVRRVPTPVKLAITGTPLENSLMDLWALLSIVAPGLYPDPDRFTEQYRRPIEVNADQARLARLRRRIRPLMLRRRKEEVAPDLPPKVEQVLRVELSAAQRRLYNQHLQRERQRVLGMLEDVEKNRMAIFRALTTLRQLALAPVLVDADQVGAGSAKLDALLDSVAELTAEGHRALVFSQFTGFLALLRARLDKAGIGYAYLDGRTRNRAAVIDRFRSGEDPLFLISLKAGGFGLTLTEADYVFVLDPWWNPAAEAQAVDRTHRIGQDRTVMVYRLVSTDTIEDKVVALQERKRRLFEDVVEGTDPIGGALTADDIRALLGVEPLDDPPGGSAEE